MRLYFFPLLVILMTSTVAAHKKVIKKDTECMNKKKTRNKEQMKLTVNGEA